MVGLATLTLAAVSVRMALHQVRCMLGKDRWTDALVEADLDCKINPRRDSKTFIE